MSYLVLARKWRPQRFDEVVGQSHVTKTLANAIEQDRVAHAFMFSGVRGVGKTSLARILAKSLNCAEGPTPNPCGSCESCIAVTKGTSVDVIEIDGASNNSVDDIRQLRETVPYRPVLGRFKIYVIDEVHMLSISAFNALLKTLEEPPSHVKFIFATTESHKVPVTILSRCQRYDFRRIPTQAIVDRIRKGLAEEKIRANDTSLYLIGREAEGSMRDALSILDQILAAGADEITGELVSELLGMVEGQIFHELSAAILGGNPKRVIEVIRRVDHQGYDVPTFAKGLLEHFSNLVVAGVCEGDKSILDLPDQEADALFKLASSVSTETLHRLFKHFSESYEAIARSTYPRILLETTLARLADLGELVPASELVSRLETLAAKMSSSETPPAQGGEPGPGQTPPAGGGQMAKGTPVTPPQQGIGTRTAEEDAKVTTADHDDKPIPKETDWTSVVNTLKKTKPTIASLLEYGALKTDESRQSISILFSKDHDAIFNLALERKDEIKRGIERIVGRAIGINILTDDTAPIPNVTKRRIQQENALRLREEKARLHPLVRKVQSELGGAITQVRVSKPSNKPDA
jgi:DNA polymerase-3 subunit gamma/tau